jgi:hypothetical protein
MASVLLVNNPAPIVDGEPKPGYSLPGRLACKPFQPFITWQIRPNIPVEHDEWAVFWLAGEQAAALAMGRIIDPPRQREESPWELQFFANPNLAGHDPRALIEILAVHTVPKATVKAALPGLFHHWTFFQATAFPLEDEELSTFLGWYSLQ